MTENNELYDHLSAARVVYQDTLENELDIIKELKIYLLESGFIQSQINQVLYNFYQHINIPITQESIHQVSITQDPMLNILVEFMLNPQNNNTFISSQNNLDINDDTNLNINDNENMPPNNINDNTNPDINDNIDSDNENIPPNNIGSHINIINVLNSLIINLNNNNIINDDIVITINHQLPTFENVVVTVDDTDFENLNTCVLTSDHELDCSICMSKMCKDEKITTLKCSHVYHTECITPYLKEYNYKCPICRSEVGKAKYNI